MAGTWRNNVPRNTLIIAGAGGFGREVFQWAQDQINAGTADFDAVKFIDDTQNSPFPQVAQNYLGPIASYVFAAGHRIVIAVGQPETRAALARTFAEKNVRFGNVVHPSAIVADSCKYDSGLILCPFALLSVDVLIGQHVHINTNSSVGHDTVIGDYVTLSSHVDVTGKCHIHDNVFFGSGARVLPGCSIAAESKIGAGATVQRSVRKKAVLYQLATKKM
jgi:sugar O-acyltransferase (sialic acid O-acetyltransferase NeuD family)